MGDIAVGFPMPYPDPELYEAVIETGFRMFPERKDNYIKYQTAARGATVDYLPIKLDIEPVSRCNYRCTMCIVSDWPNSKRAADMTFGDYRALLDQQYGLIEIKLQGLGEPLLGSVFIEMIAYARSKGIWVRSVTNASLLHVGESYKKIIDGDICELQVSIDGATRKTYERIRRGGRFDRVRENCIMLNSYADKAGVKRTRMWTTVQRDNFGELEDIVVLSSEWGFERLTFGLDLEGWGTERWLDINEKRDMRAELDGERVKGLVELGLSRDIEVTFWASYKKFEAGDPEKACLWPFERGVVTSDMRITPCCMIPLPEVADLGDAHRYSEAWNGEVYQRFRVMHLTGNIPPYCRTCYLSGNGK